jgi:hypothetical protein
MRTSERQRQHRARVRAAQEQQRRRQGYETCPHCGYWIRVTVQKVAKKEKRLIRSAQTGPPPNENERYTQRRNVS